MAVFKRPAPPPAASTSTPTVSSPVPTRPPVRPPMQPPTVQEATGRVSAPIPTRPNVQPPAHPPAQPPQERLQKVAKHYGIALPKEQETTQDSFKEAEAVGQITMIRLHSMNVLDRFALWQKLNTDTESSVFLPILRPEELPKRMVKEHPPAQKPPAGKGVLWCCYCADWNVFQFFSYIGSNKCTGCGMSTKDFYNRSANKLWGADV